MSALESLRNDKDAILAILSEYFDLSDKEKSSIKMRPFDNHNCSRTAIRHGEWLFCYHREVGVLYIK